MSSYYCQHLTDEETEGQRLGDLPKVAQLVSDGAGTVSGSALPLKPLHLATTSDTSSEVRSGMSRGQMVGQGMSPYLLKSISQSSCYGQLEGNTGASPEPVHLRILGP